MLPHLFEILYQGKKNYVYIEVEWHLVLPSVVGRIMTAPLPYTQTQIQVIAPETCNCYFSRKKNLCKCDSIKDFEMRKLTWIMEEGPKWSHMYPSKREAERPSLLVLWLRICLPMQGTWVWSLVWVDSMCCGATKPMHHKYWSLHGLEPVLHNKGNHSTEKPRHCNWRVAPTRHN